MKRLILILIVFIASNTLNAQNFQKRNSLVVETNLIATLSFSYDRIIPIEEKTAFMIGGSYKLGVGFGGGSHWLAPELGFLFLGPKHYLETGLQYVFDVVEGDEEEDSNSSPCIRIAYRLQGSKGFTFRASANFLFDFDPFFLPEIGIGYTF